MQTSWRLPWLAAALNLTVVCTAMAQTIIVKNAPPGSTVELLLNATAVGTATVAATGDATLTMDVSAGGKKPQTDANFHVDLCGTLRRIVVVERGVPAPVKESTCERHDIPGLFLVQKVTNVVIDVGGSTPTLWLRQGAVPEAWLRQGPLEEEPERLLKPSPTGLVLSGGGAFTSLRDALFLACGEVQGCTGSGKGFGYAGSVTFWLAPYLGVEAGYLRPKKMTAGGNVGGFRFDSTFEAHIVTIVGKGALPLGPVRIFGQGGFNRHEGTFETIQGLEGTTAGSVTDPQTFTRKTQGWGQTYGGGIEVWPSSKFALYAEAGWATLKGDEVNEGEGFLDERVNFLLFGARVRLGR